jgi:hypothetical protein
MTSLKKIAGKSPALKSPAGTLKTKLHTRTNHFIPFYRARPFAAKHLSGRSKIKNVGLFYTVAAEEILAEILKTASGFVSTKGVTKAGSKRGRIKAENLAKALKKKDSGFYGVVPDRVCGEFVKEHDDDVEETKGE